VRLSILDAAPATGAKREFVLECVKRRCASGDRVLDVDIADAVADADDHVSGLKTDID